MSINADSTAANDVSVFKNYVDARNRLLAFHLASSGQPAIANTDFSNHVERSRDVFIKCYDQGLI